MAGRTLRAVADARPPGSVGELGFVDVAHWLRWRETRNRLAHEYPDAPALRHAQVLAAIEAARALVLAYRAWSARLPVSGAT